MRFLIPLLAVTALFSAEPVHIVGEDQLLRFISQSEVSVNNPKPKTVMVMLTASWCGPCQSYKTRIRDIPDVLKRQIAYVDVDENKEIASQYKVRSIPSFIFYSPNDNPVSVNAETAFKNLDTDDLIRILSPENNVDKKSDEKKEYQESVKAPPSGFTEQKDEFKSQVPTVDEIIKENPQPPIYEDGALLKSTTTNNQNSVQTKDHPGTPYKGP